MEIPVSDRFAFRVRELPQKLSRASEDILTGYWLCEFLIPDRHHRVEPFYLGLSKGHVVFSGQQVSWEALVKTFQRYIPRLRSDAANLSMLAASQRWRSTRLLDLFDECYRSNLISPQEVTQALRLKILSDFDTYLFSYSGQAQFIPSFQLGEQVPIAGFDLQELLSEAQQRQFWWNKLQAQIPSMSCIPVLNRSAVQASDLSSAQKHRLEVLASQGKTLDEIAFVFAQDSLEIAKFFAKLISQGFITLTSSVVPQLLSASARQNLASEIVAPNIFVVDDSPLLLRQFQNLVTRWGYQVNTASDPVIVIETMLRVNPSIAFLDINMPGISGFDLVKQIRRCPEFATIPLIILTAEKTLTNNWRARWSGCRFLTKPLTPIEVPQFQTELRGLLEEMVPLHSAHRQKQVSHLDERHFQLSDNSV